MRVPRAVSIHIGVNRPKGRMTGFPLLHCEKLAWRMAGLAERAGYESMLVLRGAAATRQAVHDALTAAAASLEAGDRLLVTFCGHGCEKADEDRDEGHGWDETWCLSDGEIVDDELACHWRRFKPGVRIVVVGDSCHSGGIGRDEDPCLVFTKRLTAEPRARDGIAASRPRGGSAREAADYASSCIAEPPRSTDGIQASVLLLTAATEEQQATEGLFTCLLLHLWNGGDYRGSFCDLYRAVRQHVMNERSSQDPQLLMLGAPDPDFPLQRAFHVVPPPATRSDS
jgi:hypothetical protein